MPEACLDEIHEFLAQKRIAVVGASRNPKDFNAMLFREFRRRGYDVVPVNPKAPEVDGLRSYESVQDIQPPVDAALLLTPPDVTATVAKDCVEAGVKHVWMYRATGKGAVSDAGLELCRKNGVKVVPGYCPFMFLPHNGFHGIHGFVMKILRAYPR